MAPERVRSAMADTKEGRDKKGLDEDRRQREHELEEELEERDDAEERAGDREDEEAERELADDE